MHTLIIYFLYYFSKKCTCGIFTHFYVIVFSYFLEIIYEKNQNKRKKARSMLSDINTIRQKQIIIKHYLKNLLIA